MAILRSALTDGASGSNITTGDAGDPTPFVGVTTTGGTLTRDQTPGTSVLPMFMKMVNNSNANCVAYWTTATTNQAALHFYYYATSFAERVAVASLGTASPSYYLGIEVDSVPAGRVYVTNNAGTALFTSSTNLSTSTLYRFEASLDNTAAAGSHIINLNVYLANSTSPISGLTYSTTTASTGTSSLVRANFGRYTRSTTASTYWLGDLASRDGGTTEIGQYGSAFTWTKTITIGG